jgi:hypothetical protein
MEIINFYSSAALCKADCLKKEKHFFSIFLLGRKVRPAASSLIVSWATFDESDRVKIVVVGIGGTYQDAWCGKTPEKNPNLVRGSNLVSPECIVARHALGHSTPRGITLKRYFIYYEISNVCFIFIPADSDLAELPASLLISLITPKSDCTCVI